MKFSTFKGEATPIERKWRDWEKRNNTRDPLGEDEQQQRLQRYCKEGDEKIAAAITRERER